MIFRQLFEPDSSTYTYLVSCPDTGKTALIDPVLDTAQRDARILQDMGLKLDFAVPGNACCGECPDNVPEQYRAACERRDQG